MLKKQHKQRVLIVDDDELICELIAEEVSDLGYEVTQALSADQAIAELKASQFDLMVTDQSMPDMTGIELIHQASKLTQSKIDKYILITGYGEEIMQEFEKELADKIGFVAKPFKRDAIERAIDEILEKNPKVA